MHVRELWHSPRPSARLARTLLLPASWGYALGWQAYLAVYQLGLKKPKEPHGPVVCVGNLQVGGSGKTPVTLSIARTLRALSHEVAVSCSGYGSPRAAGASLAPAGELQAREWGDEPAMLRWLEPELSLVVGRDRVAAAELIHREMPKAVMLMDDGFQHLPLRKHLTLVLDPLEPDNRWCLPAGPYREPRSNRSRADVTVPGSFRVEAEPMRLLDPMGNVVTPEEYSVLCALGDPTGFVADLAATFPNKVSMPQIRLLPDHDPLDAGTLFDGLPPQVSLVVTAKDWVKLRERADIGARSVLIATHDVHLEPRQEFESFLEGRLTQGW